MSDDDGLQKILDQLQAGHHFEENFHRLYKRYYRRVHAFFAHRGCSPADCEDLIQETFLGIYRGIRSFRRDAPFETWLFKVATNAWRKRLRNKAADKRAGEEVSLDAASREGDDPPLLDPVAAGPSPEDSVLRDEMSHRLREEIDRLPDQMRKCLMLQVYPGFKEREIAELLHLALGTVKAHLHQARRRLGDALGPDFGDSSP